MQRLVVPARIAGVLVGLLVLAGVVLWLAPSNQYIFLPDPAHPVAPLVRVQGGKTPDGTGGIYFVDVFERKANLFESLFPFIHSGATLYPASEIVPSGSTDSEVQRADRQAMTISQQVAAAVALRRLGYHVQATPDGVIVSQLLAGTHADGTLQPLDVVAAANGKPTPTIASLHDALANVHPGQTVTLRLRRGAKTLTVRLKTTSDPQQPGRAIVGFVPDQGAAIKLPIHVSIDAGNIGGPSAGLAFALQVMEDLGHPVDRGYRIAATGEMELNGTVSAIGGIEQKTYGVRAAHADVFLVPVAGNNAADAEKYAHGLKIIPVTSFAQALRALARLPRKH